jgi:hypothetical protein
MKADVTAPPGKSKNIGRRPWRSRLRCHSAGGLLAAAMLSGCATSGSTPYPYFERLEIEVLAPVLIEETDVMPSTGEAAAAGAAGGALGVLMSGAFMSLLCGPYFAVCFAGTGAATVGGATVGAVLGGSTALSAEDAELVNNYLENLQQKRNLSEELATAVSTQLPAARLAAPGMADARLGLEAQGLRVTPGLGDTFALWVTAKAHLDWNLEGGNPRQASRGFACHTEAMPLEDWLSGSNASTQQELARCINDLAEKIITALKEPSSEPDPHVDPAAAMGFGNSSG